MPEWTTGGLVVVGAVALAALVGWPVVTVNRTLDHGDREDPAEREHQRAAYDVAVLGRELARHADVVANVPFSDGPTWYCGLDYLERPPRTGALFPSMEELARSTSPRILDPSPAGWCRCGGDERVLVAWHEDTAQRVEPRACRLCRLLVSPALPEDSPR